MTAPLEALPGICAVARYGPAAPPALLIELPHGATRRAHYDAVRHRLDGPLPDGLEAFFFVNTDVGTPECAHRVATALAARGFATLVLRCLLPRTFVDCNRVVDGSGAAMTPALPAYLDSRADRERLADLHRRYHTLTGAAYEAVLGADERALALQLHSYAPKSVQIDTIDDDIVPALRRAYEPAQYAHWAERPPVELITETPAGDDLSPPAAAAALRQRYATVGLEVATNATYRLHEETWGDRYAARDPQRVLCVELNRGLLATPFDPFAEMRIGEAEAKRLAQPIAEAVADALKRA
ncbi:MAG: N-formylglutamate amidohydrolase [Pseudomonadota bacterium]